MAIFFFYVIKTRIRRNESWHSTIIETICIENGKNERIFGGIIRNIHSSFPYQDIIDKFWSNKKFFFMNFPILHRNVASRKFIPEFYVALVDSML